MVEAVIGTPPVFPSRWSLEERAMVQHQKASSNSKRREEALAMYVENLSPNLLRAYVLDMIKDAPPQRVDEFIVAFKAQNDVPRKE